MHSDLKKLVTNGKAVVQQRGGGGCSNENGRCLLYNHYHGIPTKHLKCSDFRTECSEGKIFIQKK